MYKTSDGRTIQELVKRDDWQKIRKSLIGQWNKEPEECLKKIKQWMGNVRMTNMDKLYIVLNYLTGTGFRTKAINYEPVTALKEEIKEEIKRRKGSL